MSQTSISFSSARDEATTVVSEPGVRLGSFAMTTTCAGIAAVSTPDVYGTIYVTPQHNGRCSLNAIGFDGQSAKAEVSVDVH